MTRLLISSTLAAAAIGLAACGTGAGGLGPPPLNPISRFALQVVPGVDRIALAVHDHGLSANQRQALAQLAARYAAEGAPMIRVETPSGDDPRAVQTAWDVKSALESYGVPAERVVVESYPAPDARAPVLAGFEVLRAHVPDCSRNWNNLSATGQNSTAANFGCAVHANMAAQIDNPRDIVQPRVMTPADAARRGVVFDLYRQGQPTSAPQEALLGGEVSEAVE